MPEEALMVNTMFFSLPTADAPSMQLPPPRDELAVTPNVIYICSLHDPSKPDWDTMSGAEYMRIVRERKQQCHVYSSAVICHDEDANVRLPQNRLLLHCAQEVKRFDEASKF